MKSLKVPKSELEARTSNLQKEIVREGLDSALILQLADKFYFSGTVQDGAIFIPDQGKTVFMVRKSIERAREESHLDNIIQYESYRQMKDILSEFGYNKIKKIGLELDVMPFSVYSRVSRALPNVEFYNLSKAITDVRMVKSPWELDVIKGAGNILVKAIGSVPDILNEGMSEIELSAEIEKIMRLNGHQGVVRMRRWNQESFFGLVLSGESGAVSNYMDAPLGGLGPSPAAPRGATFKVIKRNEPIIVDIVGGYNGYLADCTRVFAIGKLEEGLEQAYQVCIEIQNAALGLLKKGVNLREVYDEAINIAKKSGFEDHFMGIPGSKARFIGHGIGLELDEPPVIAEEHDFYLGSSTALALEPKMIFPGKGAVGVENTWACVEGKTRNLTPLSENIVEC